MPRGDATRPNRVIWHEITCPICSRVTRLSGREYHHRQMQTCGRPNCTRALHLLNDTKADKAARLRAADSRRRDAHAASPLSSSTESNASAKEWHLLSPDGTAYHFRNLSLWLREHAELFEPDDVAEIPQSRTGVTTRAQSKLGRLRPDRAQPRQTWKGWRWLQGDNDE